MKYTRRLKIVWLAFLALVAFGFLVQDIYVRSFGMDTVIYALVFMFLGMQLHDFMKHNDEG